MAQKFIPEAQQQLNKLQKLGVIQDRAPLFVSPRVTDLS